ncbi:MAG: hypothetical protein U1F43_26015 [Myxococcota bacterium]
MSLAAPHASTFALPGYRVGPVGVAPASCSPRCRASPPALPPPMKRWGDAVGLVVSEFIQIEMLTRGNL